MSRRFIENGTNESCFQQNDGSFNKWPKKQPLNWWGGQVQGQNLRNYNTELRIQNKIQRNLFGLW